MQEAGFSYGSPEQVTIQRYVPSGGIRPHVDRDVYGNLSFLSYGTPCVLTLEHLDGIQKTDLRIDPGSLYVLRRSARYDWKHGIAQGTQTFRGRVIEILDGSRRTSVCFRKRDPVQQEYMHVL
jgi:alkylated DNA repair protein alkB family protein 7